MLYCLRSDRHQNGHTLTLELQNVLPLLNEFDIKVLRSKKFKTSVDWNFGNLDAARGAGPLVSVIFGSQESPMIFYDDEYILGIDDESQRVLDKLRDILHEHMYGVLLNPGELIMMEKIDGCSVYWLLET